jgi:hypothetical protein
VPAVWGLTAPDAIRFTFIKSLSPSLDELVADPREPATNGVT